MWKFREKTTQPRAKVLVQEEKIYSEPEFTYRASDAYMPRKANTIYNISKQPRAERSEMKY